MKTQIVVRSAGALSGVMLGALGLSAFTASGQTFAPDFSGNYVYRDLGSAPTVPGQYGGLTFKFDDPNTILLGGSANNSSAAIYAVGVTRGLDNHITGFSGTPSFYANATGMGGGIDGGLTYGPNNVLFYTSYSDNYVGLLRPGAMGPEKLIDMGAKGIPSSVGSLAFVPTGFAGGGRLKILSYNGNTWHDAAVSPDGNGLFDININGSATVQLSGGLEGVVYVSGLNPAFGVDSILVSEYGAGRISAYAIDANGDPIVASRRDFLSGLSGAEGAAVDPVTGDFIFSTFGGGNRLLVVSGFTTVPEPTTWALLGLGAAAMVFQIRRRK